MNKGFLNEQKERLMMPWRNSAFVSYFIWIIILFGGIGIGLTIFDEYNNCKFNINSISKSIATTFVAIIAASLADLNLSLNIKNVPSLTINSIGFFGLSILLMVLAFTIDSAWGLVPAILGYFIAIIIWVLANCDNEKLSDESYLQNIKNKVSKLSGSLDDIDE